MPRNLEAARPPARLVWRGRNAVHVSFTNLPRAFDAIDRLREQAKLAEYDGQAAGRHWVMFKSRTVKK
jgi:hypothetical protein